MNAAGRRLHAGVSFAYRKPPGDRRLAFRTQPEINLSERRLVSTGTLSDVDDTPAGGIPAHRCGAQPQDGRHLPGLVRPRLLVHHRRSACLRCQDWHLRPGAPERNLWGACELAACYSVLHLDDGPITGGEERNWTLGLNWYVNRQTRLMVNWIDAEADPNGDGDREGLRAIQARVQFFF